MKGRQEDDTSGHDWWHTYRVWKSSRSIAEKEGTNLFIVEVAALLHDVADHKFHEGDIKAGPRASREWLESLRLEEDDIAHICEIVENVSFKGAKVESKLKTKEGMIVQDADRLDGIGVMGIVRTFRFGGSTGEAIHDPTLKPKMHESFEEHKNKKSSSINHFYENSYFLKIL